MSVENEIAIFVALNGVRRIPEGVCGTVEPIKPQSRANYAALQRRKYYDAIKADPIRYAKLLETKREYMRKRAATAAVDSQSPD